MLYHSLEKGMCMPKPRPGFGQEKAENLLREIETCLAAGSSDAQIGSALKVLMAYCDWQEERGHSLPAIQARVESLWRRVNQDKRFSEVSQGGRKEVNQQDLLFATQIDFERFVKSRHSIRNFTDREIEREAIERAVRIAQKSPSVCNRPSVRLHVYNNDERGKKILSIQQGNSGFGHLANKIFIVTSDLASFLSVGERNQSWIDGGLFAMTFIYALHSQGIGTCCLNWSKTMDEDMSLREVVGISGGENIIMLIVAGYPPESIHVPQSYRPPLDTVLHFNT